MAQLVVRDLNDTIKKRLQQRAKRHGRSMEAEVREILQNAVIQDSGARAQLGTSISKRFRSVGLDSPVKELRDWDVRVPDFVQ